MSWFSHLNRLEHDGIPIYVDPERPDWFVPSSRTDVLLQTLLHCGSPAEAVAKICLGGVEVPQKVTFDYSVLEDVLGRKPVDNYLGRHQHLELNVLKEIWFHLTDKCNLSCRHCLFGSSPAKSNSIGEKTLKSAIQQATELGCRLFYFTGGEPFLYPNFPEVIKFVQEIHPDSHGVELTNGLLLQENLESLLGLDLHRFHLQVSLDGLQEEHDFLRGKGSFSRLGANLQEARNRDLAITISVAVLPSTIAKSPCKTIVIILLPPGVPMMANLSHALLSW